MKKKEVSGGLKICTLPKSIFRRMLLFLFALTSFSWFAAVFLYLEANMFYYCLCICLLKAFWSSFRGRDSRLSSKITKSAVNCCYTLQARSYNLLLAFTLFIILLESTTSKISRSSSTYSRRLINNMMVDAFQLDGSINNSNVSLNIKEETSNVIPGKNLFNTIRIENNIIFTSDNVIQIFMQIVYIK